MAFQVDLARNISAEGPAERNVVAVADEEARQAKERRDADRRKDEFLALLAHELRNPLAPIVAGIDLLRHATDKPEVLEQVTATMARQAKQLVRLVDDLLELSRVSGGRLRLRKSARAAMRRAGRRGRERAADHRAAATRAARAVELVPVDVTRHNGVA